MADRLQRVVRHETETRFFYGASREKRIKRIDSADGVYWTFYVGSTEITHSESELDVSGYQHVTSGRVQRHMAGILIVDKEFRSSIYAFSYLHKNHQGSIVAISDGLGNVVDHMRYDAWGARRDVDKIHLQPPVWSAGLAPFVAQFTAYTHKGYTGHEHVDQAGIIHMEGRIYDPILGRFLQADPLIEDVGTLNRYTYVHNNPLAFVDPNGFFSIGNLLKGLAIAAISIATGFAATALWTATKVGAIAVAAAGGAITGFVATGTGEGALFGAFTAVAALGVSQYLSDQPWAFDSGSFTTEGTIARSVGVGLSSGISSDLQGGKFGHGFFTAGVSSLVSPAISDMSDSDYLNAFGASLVGGTLSKATGGKFANGAATAAMAYALSARLSRGVTRDEVDGSDFDDKVRHNWRLVDKVRVVESETGSTLYLGPFKVGYSGISEEFATGYVADAGAQWTTVASGPDGSELQVQLELSLTDGSGDFNLSPCTMEECGWAAGAAERAGQIIYVRRNHNKTTPGHEFGHIFGLGHQPPGTRSIMSGNYMRSVQYSDIERLIDFYGD